MKGGKQRNFTTAINGRVNRNIMFRFNSVSTDASRNSSVTHIGQDEKAHAFTARTRIAF